jgi:hypothetical protein
LKSIQDERREEIAVLTDIISLCVLIWLAITLLRHFMAASYEPMIEDVEPIPVEEADLRDVDDADLQTRENRPLTMPIRFMARFKPLERRRAG